MASSPAPDPLAFHLTNSVPSAQQQSLVPPQPATQSDATSTSAISSTVIVGSGHLSERSTLDDSLEVPRQRQLLSRQSSKHAMKDAIPDSEGEQGALDMLDSPDQPIASTSKNAPPVPSSPDPIDTLRRPRTIPSKRSIVIPEHDETPVLPSSSPAPRAPATDEALDQAHKTLRACSEADDEFAPGVEPVDGKHAKKRKKKAATMASGGTGGRKKPAAKGKKASSRATVLDIDDDKEPMPTKRKATAKAKAKGKSKAAATDDFKTPEIVESEDTVGEIAPIPGPSNATTIILSSDDALPLSVKAVPAKGKKRARTASNFSVDVSVTEADGKAVEEGEGVKPKKRKKRMITEESADEPAAIEETVVDSAAEEAADAEQAAPIEDVDTTRKEPTPTLGPQPADSDPPAQPTAKAKGKGKAAKNRPAIKDSDDLEPEASESEAEEAVERPKGKKVAAKAASKDKGGKGKAVKTSSMVTANGNKENEGPAAAPKRASTSKTAKLPPVQPAKPGSIAAICAKHNVASGFRMPGLSRRAPPSVGLLTTQQREVVAKPPIPKARERKKKGHDGDTSEDTDEESERKKRERREEGWSDGEAAGEW